MTLQCPGSTGLVVETDWALSVIGSSQMRQSERQRETRDDQNATIAHADLSSHFCHELIWLRLNGADLVTLERY
jgi:hypothetical protein